MAVHAVAREDGLGRDSEGNLGESVTGRQRCGRPGVFETKNLGAVETARRSGLSACVGQLTEGPGLAPSSGSRTRRGCSSLKIESVDCTRRLQHVSDRRFGSHLAVETWV